MLTITVTLLFWLPKTEHLPCSRNSAKHFRNLHVLIIRRWEHCHVIMVDNSHIGDTARPWQRSGFNPMRPGSTFSFLSTMLCCLSLLSDLWDDIIPMGSQYCYLDLEISELSLHRPCLERRHITSRVSPSGGTEMSLENAHLSHCCEVDATVLKCLSEHYGEGKARRDLSDTQQVGCKDISMTLPFMSSQ